MRPIKPMGFLKARFVEPQFTPYATAIGESTLAWNDLHEHLGRFYGLLTMRSDWGVALAKWQACKVDTNKRNLLRKALAEAPADLPSTFPNLAASVTWVLAETDKLQERRNNVAHVPLHLVAEPASPVTRESQHQLLDNAQVRPHYWAGNPRAEHLAGADILAEYQLCRATAVALRDFILDVGRHVEARLRGLPSGRFPEIPALPET